MPGHEPEHCACCTPATAEWLVWSTRILAAFCHQHALPQWRISCFQLCRLADEFIGLLPVHGHCAVAEHVDICQAAHGVSIASCCSALVVNERVAPFALCDGSISHASVHSGNDLAQPDS